jgi:exodeoxyribonuclease VII large subunit
MHKNVDFDLDKGLQVLVKGAITTYEPRSRYQLNITQILPVGEGISLLRLKRLKEKLAKEGLFDESRKKPIPILPRKIGIITSKNGAALKDILKVVETRFLKMNIVIVPVMVQGEAAPKDIISGLTLLSTIDEVDTIILARGGGSAEELMVFNDEALVRAISASNKPIVTGIGHEKDTTLADLVADLRASTPSTAAKAAVSDVEQLKDTLNSLKRHLERSYKTYLSSFEVDKKDVEIKKKKAEIAKYKVITIILIFIIILISILIIVW